MNEKLIFLVNWVEFSIHPKQLINYSSADEQFFSLTEELTTRLKILKNTLIKQGLINRKQIKSILKRLLDISNTIYHYLHHLSSAWNQRIAAPSIKSFYLKALHILEHSLGEIGKLSPQISKVIPVTLFARPNVVMALKEQYTIFLNHLETNNIDNNLRIVVQRGIYQMIHKKEITTFNAEYCHNLMRAVNGQMPLDTDSLTNTLYLYGFNLPEFYLYSVAKYKSWFDNLDGLHEQLGMLLTERDKLMYLPQLKEVLMLPHLNHTVNQLISFLSEKEHFFLKMLKLQRVILHDNRVEKLTGKVKVNLSVAQFALFIRLQMEKGLLLKENIGDQFSFFANHFYTSQTTSISAESLRKKSTDVEFGTAQKLKGNLISMLNWLNENYNMSNYKNS